MRMRTTVSIAALLLVALLAAPAQGKLVYVKQADTASPVVYVATDKGKHPRRLGIGRGARQNNHRRRSSPPTTPARATPSS
jgi:hypothetical protein